MQLVTTGENRNRQKLPVDSCDGDMRNKLVLYCTCTVPFPQIQRLQPDSSHLRVGLVAAPRIRS
jgi:hypothetical protein